jgi:hypothetical protein
MASTSLKKLASSLVLLRQPLRSYHADELKLRLSRLFAAFVGSLILALLAAFAAAQSSHAGLVTGVVDGVAFEGDQYFVHGWACQEGNRGSISVNIYANHPAGGTPPGTYVMAGAANLDNEPAVDRECHDANGGKHRFRIALPNQLLRTFQDKKLFVHGIALVGNVENAALAGSGKFAFPSPKWPADPPTPTFLDGPRVAAFDTQKESCEQIDIPDAAARAFRDYKGIVHLIASHYVTRAGLGPSLEAAKHNCQVVYKSPHDGNIADFNDATWLNAFYNIDGKRIVALGHMEYHGWEHLGMCASKTDSISCWYNVDTFNLSEDGGYHFARPKPPGNFFLSLPYKYQPNQGPEGYSVDANIVKVGEWYYDEVYAWAWPPNCGGGKGQKPCLVSDGACAIRTANILDPASWRGWDGKDFTVEFVDSLPSAGGKSPGPCLRSRSLSGLFHRNQLSPSVSPVHCHPVEPGLSFLGTARRLFYDLAGLYPLEQAGAGDDAESNAQARAGR